MVVNLPPFSIPQNSHHKRSTSLGSQPSGHGISVLVGRPTISCQPMLKRSRPKTQHDDWLASTAGAGSRLDSTQPSKLSAGVWLKSIRPIAYSRSMTNSPLVLILVPVPVPVLAYWVGRSVGSSWISTAPVFPVSLVLIGPYGRGSPHPSYPPLPSTSLSPFVTGDPTHPQ